MALFSGCAVKRSSKLPKFLAFPAMLLASGFWSPLQADDSRFYTAEHAHYMLSVERLDTAGHPTGLDAPPVLGRARRTLDSATGRILQAFNLRELSGVRVNFVSPKTFYALTGAPTWTQAIFTKGEIKVPLRPEETLSPEFGHLLQHEYTHAVINRLSGSRCPAWLDEGLALILEHQPQPDFEQALSEAVDIGRVPRLRELRNGFTTFSTDRARAAYGVSLFSADLLLKRSSWPAMLQYLKLLGSGREDSSAFASAFGITPEVFETEVLTALQGWASDSDYFFSPDEDTDFSLASADFGS